MHGINDGQRLLVESAQSLGKIARACEVSRATVQRWKRGDAVPREGARAAIRDAFGIGVEAWDVALPVGFEISVPTTEQRTGRAPKTAPKTKAKAASKPRPKSTKAPPKKHVPAYPVAPHDDASIVVNLRYSLRCIRHDLEHRDLTTSARSKLRSDEARTLGLIAKWQKDEELSEDRYVEEHPRFVEHCAAVLAALKDCPDCLARVAKALRR